MIECEQNKTCAEFLEKNEDHLLKNESMNNLILGLADLIVRNLRGSSEPVFFTMLKDGKIVGQAMRTQPNKPLAITDMNEDLLKVLTSTISDLNLNLTGVVGPKRASSIFAKMWSKGKGVQVDTGLHQGIYELVEVTPPSDKSGTMLVATDEHKNVVLN